MPNKKNFSKEWAFINRCRRRGQSHKQIHDNIGVWSNKDMKKVMQKENITFKQYREKFSFLFNVYMLLEDNKKV